MSPPDVPETSPRAESAHSDPVTPVDSPLGGARPPVADDLHISESWDPLSNPASPERSMLASPSPAAMAMASSSAIDRSPSPKASPSSPVSYRVKTPDYRGNAAAPPPPPIGGVRQSAGEQSGPAAQPDKSQEAAAWTKRKMPRKRCAWLPHPPSSPIAAVESLAMGCQDIVTRFWVQRALRGIAAAKGSGAKDCIFTADDVVEAMKLLRPKPKKALLERVRDEKGFRRAVHVASTVCLICMVVAVVVAQLFMALTVFAWAPGFSKELSIDVVTGSLCDPLTEETQPVATSSTVDLRSVWDLAQLPLAELRRVDDVVFVHNQATHVLRVGMVTFTAQGAVELHGTDDTVIRVASDGTSSWQRPGYPEVSLDMMDAWRQLSQDAEIAWLSSAGLGTDVALPA